MNMNKKERFCDVDNIVEWRHIITILFALVAMTGLAQKHLPAFQYSKEPAVLSGQIIENNQQITESATYFTKQQ